MALHDCLVVAVEGSHASGKTTLVHALTAHYRSQGLLVDCVDEPARTSPFVEDVVLHGQGAFDIELEVDLFAAQLVAQLRASRHQQLLFTDKTIMNVAAYARLVLDGDTRNGRVIDALDLFCTAWSHTYDLVLFCSDNYAGAGDPFRALVAGIQDPVGAGVRAACEAAGAALTELPPRLDVGGRVAAAAAHIDPLLNLP